MALMLALGGMLAACGVVVGLAAIGEAVAAEQADQTGSAAQAAILLGSQVPPETVAALRARNLLKPGEELLAYHDATILLDGSDVTLVTSSRVVVARGATASAMALVDVARITHRHEGLLGDAIELAADDGRTLRVEIAPLNGARTYVNVLEAAWQEHRPEGRVAGI